MHIGAAARGDGLRGIVYSDRPVERSIGRGKKGKMICSQIEAPPLPGQPPRVEALASWSGCATVAGGCLGDPPVLAEPGLTVGKHSNDRVGRFFQKGGKAKTSMVRS